MKVQLRVELDEDLVASYQRQADKADKTLEDVLAARLAKAVRYTSEKPLYIDDAQRRALERLLARNFDTPQALVAEVERLNRVTVGGTRINLPPDILDRVDSRCFGRPMSDVLREEVVRGLEVFVGMR